MNHIGFSDWNETEYNALVNELNILLNTGLSISISNRGGACNRRIEEASGFFMKQVLHAYTMLQIVRPQYFPELKFLKQNAVFHDFSSAAVIVRAMFETLINMVYIIISPTSNEEFEFRKDIWDLHALCERRRIGKSISSNHPELLGNENNIDIYIDRIKNSNYYSQLSIPEKQSMDSKLQNKAENLIKWTKENTIDRALLSGINKSHSEYIYKITSAYVHAESFGIMQLLGISNEIEPLRLTQTYLRYSNMILALTLNKYSLIINLDNYLDQNIKKIIDDYVWLASQDLSKT